jgi:hypothetical protein
MSAACWLGVHKPRLLPQIFLVLFYFSSSSNSSYFHFRPQAWALFWSSSAFSIGIRARLARYTACPSISYCVVQSKSVTMKPYFGLRGTSLNIMISIIAGLDFLYVPFTF